MSIALVHPDLKKLAASWRKKVNELREDWPDDPRAYITLTCVRELEETIASIEQLTKTFSTREYARIHHVQDGTVRKWIEAGELEATKNGAGDWEIPRTAVRKRKRRTA
ncbi:MAG: hypothetical protein ACJ8AK_02890 [Gemmatimonadaceae bacterium]